MSSTGAPPPSRSDEDRARRTARALLHAASVFGDAERASIWLEAHNEALGGTIPLQLLATIEGDVIVRTELAAIDHGLPV